MICGDCGRPLWSSVDMDEHGVLTVVTLEADEDFCRCNRYTVAELVELARESCAEQAAAERLYRQYRAAGQTPLAPEWHSAWDALNGVGSLTVRE